LRLLKINRNAEQTEFGLNIKKKKKFENVGRTSTCLIRVTAVVPLQKQSIVGCNFNSLSINLKAFNIDFLSGRNISGGVSVSSTSKESKDSSSILKEEASSGFVVGAGAFAVSERQHC
jgi:hypothetical protein